MLFLFLQPVDEPGIRIKFLQRDNSRNQLVDLKRTTIQFRLVYKRRWKPPAQVDEYIYNDKNVFLFPAGCCGQINMLYDDSCQIICASSGGFTGRGDGKCADFYKAARHIKIVWKDPR